MIIREIYSRLPWKGTVIRPSTTVRIKCLLKQEALEHSEDLLVFIITNFSWNFEASTQFKLNRQWVNFSLSLTNHYKVLCRVYSFVLQYLQLENFFIGKTDIPQLWRCSAVQIIVQVCSWYPNRTAAIQHMDDLYWLFNCITNNRSIIKMLGWCIRFFFRHHDFTKHEIEM